MPPLKLSGNHTQHTLNTHLTHTHTHTQAWNSLPGSVRSGGRPSREEALQAVAVLNRIRRLLSETSGAGLRPINRTVILLLLVVHHWLLSVTELGSAAKCSCLTAATRFIHTL